MKFITLVTFFVLNGIVAEAQERYIETITDSVEVTTMTYAKKDGENLDMDIYQPAFDPTPARSVIIYVHGGGFQGGARNSADVVSFCTKLANHGFVAVSISYRLTRKGKPEEFGCQCPAIEKLNTFNSAVQDLHDATFKLVQFRENLRIDPQTMILAGSSAGAETVLNAAYQPPFCYGLDSGPVSYAGVISMAGAIPDTTSIYDESAIPSLFFHGTCDPLVPYATAPHHYCAKGQPGFIILHGAYTISRKLARLNTPYWLHTTCGGKHELAGKPMQQYFNEIKNFCYHFVIKKDAETKITVIPGNQDSCEYGKFDFCQQ